MGRKKSFDRQELINSIQSLFWERGIVGVGVNEIEQKTGVSRSSLYREFGDKDDIIYATLLSYKEEIKEGIKVLENKPLSVANIKIFLLSVLLEENPRGCYLMRMISEKNNFDKKSLKLLEDYISEIEFKIATNLLADKKSKLLSSVIVNFQTGVCNRLFLGIKREKIKQDINTFLVAIFPNSTEE